jgi:prevent-host-death family protein
MRQVNIHEAKTHLSRLIDAVEAGEEIIIARAGTPVARLTGMAQAQPRQLGILKGKIVVADDFDAPLPEDVLAAFEGHP